MKKNSNWLLGLIVLIILVVGGFLIFHKPPKTINTTVSTTSSSKNAPNQSVAVNNSVLKSKSNSTVGEYLTTPNGNTLYTYGGDTSGVSNCTGSCLANWPAYVATSTMTDLPTNVAVITRSDNKEIQYTYKGLPLYTFASESAGQVTGNGVADFSVAKP